MQTIEQIYERKPGWEPIYDFPNKAWQLATLANVYEGAGLSRDDAWDAAVADMEGLWEHNDELTNGDCVDR